MPLKVFRTDVMICATAYIVAESEAEAAKLAQNAFNPSEGFEMPDKRDTWLGSELRVTGSNYEALIAEVESGEEGTAVTLSPAMTFQGRAVSEIDREPSGFGPSDMDRADDGVEEEAPEPGRYLCTAIDYDLDEGDEAPFNAMTIDVTQDDLDAAEGEDDPLQHVLGEKITENTGFCHKGFSYTPA